MCLSKKRTFLPREVPVSESVSASDSLRRPPRPPRLAALRGLLVPMVTPVLAERPYAVHTALFAEHANNLLAQGVAGLVPFGTTGEAASFSLSQRQTALAFLIAQGVPASRLVPGVGLPALEETCRLIQHADGLKVAAHLLLPPYYFAPLSEDTLFDYVRRLLEETPLTAGLILYHIPSYARVGWETVLVERLFRAFPTRILGLKDSSGDPDYALRLMASCPEVALYSGSELGVRPLMKAGGFGTISATGNTNARAMMALMAETPPPGMDLDELERQVAAFRHLVKSYGHIQGNKALLARENPAWEVLAPPLEGLSSVRKASLFEAVDAMPSEFRVMT